VRPQLIDLTGPVGSRRSFDIFVRNLDPLRPARLWVWPADLIQAPTGAVDMGDNTAYKYSAADWLTVDKKQLLVRAGTEEKIRVSLTVPGSAKGSGHALIVVSGAPPKDVPIAPTAENQVFVASRVSFGVIFHYAIPGTAVYDAHIESVFLTSDVPPRSGLTKETSPYKHWLVARVRNNGNVMIYGYGWALLRRGKAGLVERWRLGQREYGSRQVIYPERYLDIYLPITRPLPKGDYSAQIRLDYGPNRAATAEVPLTVTASEAQASLVSSTGPFVTQTIGLAVTVDQEMRALAVAPGGYRTGSVVVTNGEDVPLAIDVTLADVTMDGDGVLVPTDTASPETMTTAWLKAAPPQFTLPPGKSRRLSFTVAVPAALATNDDLVGLLRLRGRRQDAVSRRIEDEVIGETSVLMVVTQAGRGERNAEIGVLKVDMRPELPGVVRLGVPVKNTGNVHFLPVVSLQMLGRDNPTFNIERQKGAASDQALVLPGRERLIWFELPRDQLQPGEYRADVSLDYGADQPKQQTFTVRLSDPSPRAPPPETEEAAE